jgi:trans-AT polyketide synthase/acyltransferase/oxidoreductase domain-containing protein
MTSMALTITAESLGSQDFRKTYGLKYAYIAGAMYRAIASKELVVRMGKAKLLGYYGSAGMPLKEVEDAIHYIQHELGGDGVYGMNILSNLEHPQTEMDTVALYLRYGVRYIEAAAYMQMTPALVWFRLKGLRRGAEGRLIVDHHILAKISRQEVATLFMSPAPEKIVRQLLDDGRITAEQAELAAQVPVSSEICVEADSGGHTDMGIPTVIFPPMVQLKDEMAKRYSGAVAIYMGLAGGIGSPQSAAAAFIMGADFVLTGSINQCTVEGGTSDAVKDILQEVNVQDTDYAPAGDMFELGAKVQVLKRGVFFPARANKLYALYQQYGSLAEIPQNVQKQLQERYFKRSFEQIWGDTKTYLMNNGRQVEVREAEANPKQKMARVFKWYFAYTTRLALSGDEANRVDFQVHTGPALGSFNKWLEGTELQSWRTRHVDKIAEQLMQGTAAVLQQAYSRMQAASGAINL